MELRTDRGVEHRCMPPCGATVTELPPPVSWAGPHIIRLSPDSGPAAGGTSVVITGRNFTRATAVRFGANAATSFAVCSFITFPEPFVSGCQARRDTKARRPCTQPPPPVLVPVSTTQKPPIRFRILPSRCSHCSCSSPRFATNRALSSR
jgi:hypothetical protein